VAGRLVTPGLTEAHVCAADAAFGHAGSAISRSDRRASPCCGRTGGDDAHRLRHRLYRSADRARPPQLA
jgi:hypothetical protein